MRRTINYPERDRNGQHKLRRARDRIDGTHWDQAPPRFFCEHRAHVAPQPKLNAYMEKRRERFKRQREERKKTTPNINSKNYMRTIFYTVAVNNRRA